jgi:hypothetical protein
MRSLTIAAEDGMGPVWEHGRPVDVTRLPITEPLERSLVEFEDFAISAMPSASRIMGHDVAQRLADELGASVTHEANVHYPHRTGGPAPTNYSSSVDPVDAEFTGFRHYPRSCRRTNQRGGVCHVYFGNPILTEYAEETNVQLRFGEDRISLFPVLCADERIDGEILISSDLLYRHVTDVRISPSGELRLQFDGGPVIATDGYLGDGAWEISVGQTVISAVPRAGTGVTVWSMSTSLDDHGVYFEPDGDDGS